MTTAIDPATFPLLPGKDTLERMASFPVPVYKVDETSTLYHFVDALVGDSGVGRVKKELLISRLNQKLDTTFFTDLDRVFGNLAGIARSVSETYSYEPGTDLLTPEEWDEIKVKDAWYRARIKDFFAALALGGTPDGLRKMVKAAIGVDSEIYEIWRFQDYYGDIYGVDDVETQMNLVPNPSMETGTAGWTLGTTGTGTALTRVNAPSAAIQSGTWALQLASGTGLTQPSFISADIPVVAQKNYTFSFYYYKTSTTVPNLQVTVRYKNAAGTVFNTASSGLIAMTNSARTRYGYNFTPPANTVSVGIEIIAVASASLATSTNVWFDAFMLNAGSIQSYFDGSTSGYRWTGIAHQSASIKASPIDALSRLKVPSRNEIVIYPHKQTITTVEMNMIREMTRRIAPVNSVITIKNSGYAVNVPILTRSVAADSTFFQINSFITGRDINELTPEEEPNATYRWLQNGTENQAPAKAFIESQEYSQYYLYTTNDNSAIDSVKYFKEPTSEEEFPNLRTAEEDYKIVEKKVSAWTIWTPFDAADSPDNYPGGKNGRTPRSLPALTRSGAPYVFPYQSQLDYVEQMKALILSVGGEVRRYMDGGAVDRAYTFGALSKGEFTDTQYRLPVASAETVIKSWKPVQAVSNSAPTKASTIISGWWSRPVGI